MSVEEAKPQLKAPADWKEQLKRWFEPSHEWVDVTVGEGWKDIVWSLTQELDALGIKFTITQIKEKFGSLRYYYNIDDETPEGLKAKTSTLVEEAEGASSKTCESCGAPGFMASPTFWVRTLCERCWRVDVLTWAANDLNHIVKQLAGCKAHAIVACECAPVEDAQKTLRKIKDASENLEKALTKYKSGSKEKSDSSTELSKKES